MNKNPQEVPTSIYSRLLAGESIEDIAEEFANELNEAQDRYEEEMARRAEEEEERKRLEEEAAAKEAERQKEQDDKIAIMAAILHDTVEYLDTYYPSLLEGEEITESSVMLAAGAIVEMLDHMVEPKAKWVIDPLDLMKMFWL